MTFKETMMKNFVRNWKEQLPVSSMLLGCIVIAAIFVTATAYAPQRESARYRAHIKATVTSTVSTVDLDGTYDEVLVHNDTSTIAFFAAISAGSGSRFNSEATMPHVLPANSTYPINNRGVKKLKFIVAGGDGPISVRIERTQLN